MSLMNMYDQNIMLKSKNVTHGLRRNINNKTIEKSNQETPKLKESYLFHIDAKSKSNMQFLDIYYL